MRQDMFCCAGPRYGSGRLSGTGSAGRNMRTKLDHRVRTTLSATALGAFVLCMGCDSRTPAVDASAAPALPAVTQPATDRSEKMPPTTQSALEHADPQSFMTIGPLVAEQQADISAARNGRIETVTVRIGDRVKKGQLLAQLDDRELQATCAAHRAHMQSALA